MPRSAGKALREGPGGGHDNINVPLRPTWGRAVASGALTGPLSQLSR